MTDWIQIGQIVNTKGLKGEIKIYPHTDDIERFHLLKEITLLHQGTPTVLPIEKLYLQKNMVMAKLKGIDDINAAEKYRGDFVVVSPKDAIPLPEDHYFIFDLIDCEVVTLEGHFVGKVIDVLQNRANDLFQVSDGQREVLIPNVKAFVKTINIEEKRILIDPIEGLI